MTETAARAGFFACRLLPATFAVVVAAGCSTTNLEDVAPVSSMQAPQTLPQSMTPPPAGQPAAAGQTAVAAQAPAQAAQPVQTATAPPVRDAIDTGTFPNLNVAPGVAAPQITEQEKAAKLAELGAKRSTAQATPGTNAAAEAEKIKRLRKLAQSNAADVLKEIEGN